MLGTEAGPRVIGRTVDNKLVLSNGRVIAVDQARHVLALGVQAAKDLQLRAETYRKADFYRPYAKQRLFHKFGSTHRLRCFMAGNQLGKTTSGGMEVAYHLTGDYPEWWEGKRFTTPTRWWASSITSEMTRDGPQRILLGVDNQWGTGAIALEKIDVSQISMRRGVADAVDKVLVRHRSGGWSSIKFKSYDQGVDAWQSETLHGIWLDEEPPFQIWSEAITRTNTLRGLMMLTATPLLGRTDVVNLFYPVPGTDERALVQMTIDEADHYSPEDRERIKSEWPEHEREARANGIPMLGSGRVFPISQSAIQVPAFAIPKHWPVIAGMDFGWDHPTASVWLAWDRDADVVYVWDCYAEREQGPAVHAAAIKARGADIPVAWPQDGLQHSAKNDGEALSVMYRKLGVNMLPDYAKFEDVEKNVSVEAGVIEMLTRMQTGRFKVFAHLGDWFDEFLQYHREDGKIVKLRDDRMSATRYGVMMLRYARPRREPESKTKKLLRKAAKKSARGGDWMAG